MSSQGRSLVLLGSGGLIIGLLAGILALLRTHAYSSGFSGADEPAHFLNAYVVSMYLQSWFSSNPMAFAADFYAHYPKISIGHWPPAYYALLGPVFLVIPPTIEAAFLINLIVSALPAAGVAMTLGYLSGRYAAFIGAGVYALAPLVMEGQSFFMLDQALAASCVAATIAWVHFVAAPGWKRALFFSFLCAFAVLLKGNGWLMVFVPVYYMILTKNYRLLAKPYLYGAALAAAVLVVPWYWATAGISADGFNYKAGWDYATMALAANLGFVRFNVGVVSFFLALTAIIVEYRARHTTPARWGIVSACLSLIMATLTLQSLIPVDIVDRYMAPALPAIVVLAFLGLQQCYDFLARQNYAAMGALVTVLLVASMVAPGVSHMLERHPKPDYRMAEVAKVQQNYSSPGIWLIDGSSNAEGAFIAEMALRDRSLSSYTVRASKLLADSNFMGSKYQLKFAGGQGVLREIEHLGIRNIVIAQSSGRFAFPHSEQLVAALNLPASSFKKIASFDHVNSLGKTDVYESTASLVPNFAAVRKQGLPAKASAMIHTLQQNW